MFFTPKSHRRWWLATILGIITGIIAGLVKLGIMLLLPVPAIDNPMLALQLLQQLDFTPAEIQGFTYQLGEQIIPYAGLAVYYLVSILLAILYCWLAEVLPLIKLWLGMFYGFLIVLLLQGLMLPMLGLSPGLASLSPLAITVAIVSTLVWAMLVELLRRDLRNRWTKLPDPEFKQ